MNDRHPVQRTLTRRDAAWRLVVAAGALVGARPAHAQAASAPGEAQAPPLPAVGSRLALPAVVLLDGTRFEPSRADGRITVVYWWASWCPFCALVSPHIDTLWKAERARGLELFTCSIDRRPEDAAAYLARRGYGWPAAWMSPDLHRRFPKPRGLPVTVVRGRDGRVLQAEGGQLFPEDVEAMARHLG